MFIQVIQGRVRDAAGLREHWDLRIHQLRQHPRVVPDAGLVEVPVSVGWLGSTAGISDDGEFVAVIRFESERLARQDDRRPEQREWWAEAKEYFDGEVTVRGCSEVDTLLGGGSDDAGFVQIIQGRVRDVDRVRALDRITYVRVRDIIGPNRLIIDQVANVLRPDDFPPGAAEDRRLRADRLVREAIGDATPELVRSYRLLCGLNSHDLSAMRELIGMPDRVVSASHWNEGSYLHVTMDYGDFQAVLETGVDNQVRFDAHIEVYGEMSSFRIEYDTPYIRHLPTHLVVEETAGDAFTRTIVRPTFTDPYTRELEAFHDAIVNETEIKTSAEDFVEDLELFGWIVSALRASRATAAT
jgi:hypothetical protein